MALIKGFGLIDIIFIILCILITYEAVSKGILLEILKLIGVIFSIVFSFQLYPFLAGNVTDKLPFLPKDYSKFTAFFLLFLAVTLVFEILNKIVNGLFKRKEISSLEKTPAVLLGLVRAIFLVSIVIFLTYLSPAKSDFIRGGISKEFLKNIAPKIYLVSAKSYKKIQSNFQVNEEVEKLYESR